MIALLSLAVVAAVPVSAQLPGNLVSKVGENSPVGRPDQLNEDGASVLLGREIFKNRKHLCVRAYVHPFHLLRHCLVAR